MGIHTIRHCFNENICTKTVHSFLINAWLTSDYDVLSNTDCFCQHIDTKLRLHQNAPQSTWYVEKEAAGQSLPEHGGRVTLADDKARKWTRNYANSGDHQAPVFTCGFRLKLPIDGGFIHNHSMLQAQFKKKRKNTPHIHITSTYFADICGNNINVGPYLKLKLLIEESVIDSRWERKKPKT